MHPLRFILLSKLLERFLKHVSQALWEGFWGECFRRIAYVEGLFQVRGAGQAKKALVVKFSMLYLQERIPLNWLQRFLLRTFLSFLIDWAVSTANRSSGSWLGTLQRLEGQIASWVPWITSLGEKNEGR